MATTPSGGARSISSAMTAAAVRALVFQADGIDGFVGPTTGGRAALEIVEVSPGAFETVPVGTHLGARRLISRQIGGGPIVVY